MAADLQAARQRGSLIGTDIVASHQVQRILLRSVWALPLYGLLLTLGTLTHQPDPTTEFKKYADYVTQTAFLPSHLVASLFGAVLGVVATVAAALLVAGRSGRPVRTLLGAWLTVFGNVVNAALFGVAAFAQPAIGRAQHDGVAGMQRLNDDVYGPELIGTAVVGLLVFIAGAILMGRALSVTSDALRVPGLVMAVALPLFVVAGFTVELLQPVFGAMFAAAAVLIARRLPDVVADRQSGSAAGRGPALPA